MNELVKRSPIPVEIIRDAMPISVPPREYSDGFIRGMIHNAKLGQMAKSENRRGDLAEAQLRRVRGNLEMIKAITTFSASMQDAFHEFKHRERMRDKEFEGVTLENQKTELKNQFLYQKIKEQEGKNILLQMEIKQQEIDLRMKEKEFDGFAGD